MLLLLVLLPPLAVMTTISSDGKAFAVVGKSAVVAVAVWAALELEFVAAAVWAAIELGGRSA